MTHVGARPPLLALVFRPLTVERHTYDNLRASGHFTINHVTAEFLECAHQTSAKYPRNRSEFAAVGLTPEPSTSGAPYVAESPVSFLLDFAEEHHVRANDTIIVIGAVRAIRLSEDLAVADGGPDWGRLGGLAVSGLYDYYQLRHSRSLGYARPT